MLLTLQFVARGGDCHLLCTARCSLARPLKAAHQPAVTMNGKMSQGPAQLAATWMGLLKTALRDSQPEWLWSPLELARPPLEVVLPPLEGEL